MTKDDTRRRGAERNRPLDIGLGEDAARDGPRGAGEDRDAHDTDRDDDVLRVGAEDRDDGKREHDVRKA